MNFNGPLKLAVLCDFDGTISPYDILDILYDKFAGQECQELTKKWDQGEISTPAEIQGCFASMRATRTEMESALDPVQLVPGFSDFVRFCHERGHAFAILSDGLRWYIDYILKRHGIADVTVYANDVEFAPNGMLIHSPWYHHDTPLRGTSKPAIIQKYHAEGFTVIFIGDGPTDVEAVEVADIVFAKGRLVEYCRTKGIPFTEFDHFSDVIQHWKIIYSNL
jgi:2,3-diketo-5-methylthio-1-phosphopentane phosphatase